MQAGSGGIETFAIQLAQHVRSEGAKAWSTTCGQNFDLVNNLGADHVINYQKEKFDECVKNLDIVFDPREETPWINR
jgi:alcohol dehydrogenase